MKKNGTEHIEVTVWSLFPAWLPQLSGCFCHLWLFLTSSTALYFPPCFRLSLYVGVCRGGFSYSMAVTAFPWWGHQTPTGIAACSVDLFNAPIRCFPLGICSPKCAGKCDWYEQGCAKCVFACINNYPGAMLSASTDRLVLLCLLRCWLIPCPTRMPPCINNPKYQFGTVCGVNFLHGFQWFQTQTRLQIFRTRASGCLPHRLSCAPPVHALLQEKLFELEEPVCFLCQGKGQEDSLS